MKEMRFWCFILAICGFMPAYAQSQSSPTIVHIQGVVTDASGAAIANASVFIRNYVFVDKPMQLMTHSDNLGRFELSLPPQAYDVFLTSAGFKSQLQTIVVCQGKTQKTIWKMEVQPCNFPGMNCDKVEHGSQLVPLLP